MADEYIEEDIEIDENSEEFLTAPIDDYLLALADGLHQAQVQLSQMRVPAQPGQPTITYQLPKLEFELKMSLRVTHKDKDTGKVKLEAKPISTDQAQSGGSVAEAASIIKGVFVAVPTDGGKPPAMVRTSLKKEAYTSGKPQKFMITVDVQAASGENLAGIDVQFNIDHEQSLQLNAPNGWTGNFRAGTQLAGGQVFTDANGKASTSLTIDIDEPFGKYIVILVDAAGKTETIVFKVEQP